MDINEIQAGDYELLASRWDETTSEVGKPREFIRHLRGDRLHLNQSEARRLTLAGAVRPWGSEEEPEEIAAGPAKPPRGSSTRSSASSDAADRTPRVPVSINEILAEVGDHPGKALEWLEAEKSKPKPRPQLVAKLEEIATSPSGQNDGGGADAGGADQGGQAGQGQGDGQTADSTQQGGPA